MTDHELIAATEAHKVKREYRDEIRQRTGDNTYRGLIPGIGDDDSLENVLRMLACNRR